MSSVFSLRAAALAVAASSLSRSAAGQVTGAVTLEGKPPEMRTFDVRGFRDVAPFYKDRPLREEVVVVDARGGLANVVVSIRREAGKALPEPARKPDPMAVIEEKEVRYRPHVVALAVGQKLIVRNRDPFQHNVHQQPNENEPIGMAQPSHRDREMQDLGVQKHADYFHLKCDVHPWMSAWVAVIDNPYFAVTDEHGRFELPPGLEDGEYVVVACHEKFDALERKLTVKDGKGEARFVYRTNK